MTEPVDALQIVPELASECGGNWPAHGPFRDPSQGQRKSLPIAKTINMPRSARPTVISTFSA